MNAPNLLLKNGRVISINKFINIATLLCRNSGNIDDGINFIVSIVSVDNC